MWIRSGWICYACGKSKVLDTDLDTSLAPAYKTTKNKSCDKKVLVTHLDTSRASACKTTENKSTVDDPWRTVILVTEQALFEDLRQLTQEP